jgi:hypothetical protein
MKTVEFKGKSFETPYWTEYVVADPDGSVWAYDERPIKRSDGAYGSTGYGSRYERIGWLDDPDCKWVG